MTDESKKPPFRASENTRFTLKHLEKTRMFVSGNNWYNAAISGYKFNLIQHKSTLPERPTPKAAPLLDPLQGFRSSDLKVRVPVFQERAKLTSGEKDKVAPEFNPRTFKPPVQTSPEKDKSRGR